jgi:hypothetical protein
LALIWHLCGTARQPAKIVKLRKISDTPIEYLARQMGPFEGLGAGDADADASENEIG